MVELSRFDYLSDGLNDLFSVHPLPLRNHVRRQAMRACFADNSLSYTSPQLIACTFAALGNKA